MRSSRYIFTTILLLSVRSILLAQTEPRFDHFTTKKGLSFNSVTSICQDREGFMWFGTAYGLNKYDGYNFTVFNHDPNDTNSLRNGGINSIQEDKKGRLWIGTWGGLHLIDKRTGQVSYFPQKDQKKGPNTVVDIYVDQHDILWLAGNLGLSRFDPDTKTFTLFAEKGNINSVAGDPSGMIWCSSAKGLFRFDPVTRSFVMIDVPSSITAIYVDTEGLLWIGTKRDGILQLDTKGSTFVAKPYNSPELVNKTVNRNGIFQDAQKNIWLATTEGLLRVNKAANKTVSFRFDATMSGSINSDNVQCIFDDDEGNLWVGTNNGINKMMINSKPFITYQTNTSFTTRLDENKIDAMEIDRNGTIWTGTSQGLTKLDSNLKQITRFPFVPNDAHHHSGAWVQVIYQDRSGRLWIGTEEDILLLDPSSGRFTSYPFDSSHVFTSISEDPSGILWFGGDSTLMAFDPSNKKYTYYRKNTGNSSGLNATNITKVMADRNGTIWIGTINRGLIRFNPQSHQFTDYPSNKIFPGTQTDVMGILAIYEDRKGIIWIGTNQNGLQRFDPATNTFSHFTTKEGLTNNSVTSIIEDVKGNLWIGTYGGLSRLDAGTNTFKNYDEGDGLPDNEFTRISASENKGKLLFATRNGLVMFYPDNIKSNTKPPPVYITGLTVLEKPRPLPDSVIKLSYYENFLSFDMVVLNYNSPEKNLYAYRLEGLENDWIQAGTRHDDISYTNLKPGTYVFRVKGANNDGVWNNEGDQITLIISPPWWRTWWAYSLYGLFIIVGIYSIYRLQRRWLIAKERERSREKELSQAKEIEKAYLDLKATQAQLIQAEKMASLGELTAGIAHEIQNPLNFINNFSEVNTELIDEMNDDLNLGNTQSAIEIAGNIKENSAKITHHGKRADAIVKGMLQHSRSSTRQKELTDINALTDEYVRLSYHGLRAKDKTFNAKIITDFDPDLPKVKAISQDIGRVVLNLITNAFYAVTERKKLQPENYEPLVTVSTKTIKPSPAGGALMVLISVKDNGNGVPPKIIDKIFQPFFTTKPTGQGTGLGLSLSYDIIKAHGGELKVNTKESEGAEFIIILPV